MFFLIVVCALTFIYLDQWFGMRGKPDITSRIHPADVKNVSGIAFDGNSLWITEENTQSISQINPQTGALERKIEFPVKATGGSAWDGESLWQLAWEEKKIYQIDNKTGKILHSFASPGQGTCSGMTFDGKYLWLANFEDEKIYQIDQTQDGKILQAQPGNFETTGLAWDGVYLWSGLLVGTKTHDEETPYTGFIQQKVPGTREVKAVLPITGVGTGGSNWTPGTKQATLLWWFDMYHQKLIEVQLNPKTTPLYRYGLGCLMVMLIFICYRIVGKLTGV
jgi:hypothetical protein